MHRRSESQMNPTPALQRRTHRTWILIGLLLTWTVLGTAQASESAPPDTLASLKSVIRQLDIRRAQVLVEGVVAEIRTEKAADFGIQWRTTSNPSNGKNVVGGTNFGSRGINTIATAENPLSALGNGLSLAFIDGTITFPGTNIEILNIGATSEITILELANGKNTVKEIIRASRMGSFEVSKMLYRLLSIKLIRPRVEPVAV